MANHVIGETAVESFHTNDAASSRAADSTRRTHTDAKTDKTEKMDKTRYRQQCLQEMGRIWQHSDQRVSGAVTVEDLLAVVLSPETQQTWFHTLQIGLASLDSSACAALLKELCRKGRSAEAFRIFHWMRSLDDAHEARHLLDVYTYTTMIAQCGSNEKLPLALEFLKEMQTLGIQANVHTYTALMHVYTKTDNTELALGVPELMKKEGCTPNLVTFNTLINLFRKMGEWKRAVDVIDLLDDLVSPSMGGVD